MVRPVTLGMLGAKPSGTEELVENSLSERRLRSSTGGHGSNPTGVLARDQVGSRRSTMPAPGLGMVRGSQERS